MASEGATQVVASDTPEYRWYTAYERPERFGECVRLPAGGAVLSRKRLDMASRFHRGWNPLMAAPAIELSRRADAVRSRGWLNL